MSDHNVDIVNLANSEVLDQNGSKTKLGLVWQKQRTIFIFLRHFACIACRAHAQEVWNNREKYFKTGCKLVFVGNGQPNFISAFRESLGIGAAEIYTDPSLRSYKAAGFHHGFFYVVHPGSAINAMTLMAKGHRQTKYSSEAGTHWQLGGVVAVDTNGRVLYQYISESLGDFPEEPYVDLIHEEEKNRTAPQA